MNVEEVQLLKYDRTQYQMEIFIIYAQKLNHFQKDGHGNRNSMDFGEAIQRYSYLLSTDSLTRPLLHGNAVCIVYAP